MEKITKKYRFLKEDKDSNHQVLRDWHESLHGTNLEKKSFKPIIKAVLKRCATPEEILLESAFHSFYQIFKSYLKKNRKNDQEQWVAIAVIAGLWAHIKIDLPASKSIAAQLGAKDPQSEKPKMSGLRFQQLQKSNTWKDFYRHLRKAIQIIDGQANIIALADHVLHYADQMRAKSFLYPSKPGNSLQMRWAIDYFQSRA